MRRRSARTLFLTLPVAALFLFGRHCLHRPLLAQLALPVYYVDADEGADANPGTSPQSAWQTLDRINARTFAGGSIVFFKRGCEWRGGLRLRISSSSDLPVTLGSYGSGPPPVLNGARLLSSWEPYSSAGVPIYRAAAPSAPAQVLVDGVSQELARSPNSGYSPLQGVFSASQVRVPDYDSFFFAHGPQRAKIHLRLRNWYGETRTVTRFDDQTGVISWDADPPLRYPPSPGDGSFLANALPLLDRPGEWYYDPEERALYLAFPGDQSPADSVVEAAVDPYGVFSDSAAASLRIDGLTLVNFAQAGVWARGAALELTGVRIRNSNERGVYAETRRLVITDSVIENTNSDGIWAAEAETLRIERNTLSNNGRVVPQRLPGLELNGIRVSRSGDVSVVSNVITGSGFGGITATAIRRTLRISGNRILNYCVALNDCAGVYINGSDFTASLREISHNFIQDGVGDPLAAPNPSRVLTAGIYLDIYASDFYLHDNVIDRARGELGGIAVNGGNRNVIAWNRIWQYNSPTMSFFKSPDTRFSPARIYPMDQNTVEQNSLFASLQRSERLNMVFVNGADSDNRFGVFRDNTLQILPRPPHIHAPTRRR